MHRLLAFLACAALVTVGVVAAATAASSGDGGPGAPASYTASAAASKRQVLLGTARKLTGGVVSLSRYRGRVVLVVNTASQCSNTPQYGQLETLYNRKRSKGLVVLGFPSGDFGDQELTDDKDIAAFCKKNFGVTFPMFAKTHVTGGRAHPFYQRLIREAGAPNWNFGKYLVDRQGHVVRRFDAYTPPDDETFLRAVDRALKR